LPACEVGDDSFRRESHPKISPAVGKWMGLTKNRSLSVLMNPDTRFRVDERHRNAPAACPASRL